MSCPLIIITGDKLRHMYFAQYLLNSFPEAVLVIERQPEEPWGAHLQNPSMLEQEHFKAFANAEKIFFQDAVNDNHALIESRKVFDVSGGSINTREVIDALKKYNPSVLATLSTSILKDDFIGSFPAIINYHAGLSPFYRGSGTNVFPIINREPEYIGTTIHYIDAGIDSGDIIVQGRPNFKVGDDSHSLGCKSHVVGTKLMGDVVTACLSGVRPKGFKQNLQTGRFYAKADFTDDAIKSLKRAIDDGVIDEYARKGPVEIPIIKSVQL